MSAGDKVLVVGAGVVGLAIAALTARMPATEVTVVDPDASRAELVRRVGATFAGTEAPKDQDVVFHVSGSPAGLATGLSAAADEATVIEGSWYGATQVTLPLGADFHARRLKLISSQVGMIPATRRPRWTHARRLRAALELLRDPVFDAFVTGEIAFAEAAAKVPAALKAGAPGLMTVLRY